MTRRLILLFILLLAVPPALAAAQRGNRGNETPARPASFEALVRCRALTDDAARLACFDTAVAALQAAQERREVVVVDRQQVREGRRRLFGLALPRIPIFGGGDDDEPDADRIDTVEGVVASASQDGLGHWVVALQDGAVWMQVDNRPLALRPRPGQRVVVNRGALGSFMMRVNNQPGIRVRRTR